MRRFAIPVVLLGLGLGPAGLLPGQPGTAPPEDAEVAALVRGLGDPQFDRREQAGRELERLGPRALSALVEAASGSEDLEVRRRARQLVLTLMPMTVKSKAGGFQLSRVAAGTFTMGSPAGESGRRGDEPGHVVRITRPFYLATHEVTQAQYRQVMKASPSWFAATGEGKEKVRGLDTGAFPVERVSWFDAVEFCNRLSRADGRSECYRIDEVVRKGDSTTSARVRPQSGNGYRLPTEAEWEFACRAGTTTAFHQGAQLRAGDANVQSLLVASGYGSAPKWPHLGRTMPVGSYGANAWDLQEMHGNVAEWCADWYDSGYYTVSPANDPRGPAAGVHRVTRGGSWLVPETSARAASRAFRPAGEGDYQTGFRVARNP